MNYIDDNTKNGLYYDFDKIRKEFKKLKIPKDFYNPCTVPIEQVKYIVEVSERSTGKTTNWVLFGMIMNKMYGTQIQYIRQVKDMITPKNLNQFMDVIVNNNYVEKITEGKYNSCEYFAGAWRYIRIEDGEIAEKAKTAFMFCLSLDQNIIYKSSYNAPFGDLIIFDEFISKRYMPNEFVTFSDLVKTIIRERLSPFVVMLANTTDRYNEYFRELMIQDEILKIKVNESFIKQTPLGTSIYCELIGNKNIEREKLNTLFFGFKNPRLASITGGNWAIDNYPHIEREATRTLDKRHYISYSGYLVQLEICNNERLGLFVKAHRANKLYDDSIIYSIDGVIDKRYRHRYGYSRTDKLIFTLFDRNKFYYANNEVGNMVTSYIENADKY